MTTCSMRSAGTPVLTRAPLAATAPSSSAETSLSAPPGSPSPRLPPTHSDIGVRAPPRITTLEVIASSLISRNAGELVADHQRVNFICAFVRIDSLQITHVPHRLVLAGNAVGAEDGARGARDLERLAHVVALRH